MAEKPDVLKRLEEIERPSHSQSKHELAESVSWLLRLTRALLEAHGRYHQCDQPREAHE